MCWDRTHTHMMNFFFVQHGNHPTSKLKVGAQFVHCLTLFYETYNSNILIMLSNRYIFTCPVATQIHYKLGVSSKTFINRLPPLPSTTCSFSLLSSMSAQINSGQSYTIVNIKSGTVMDLSAGNNLNGKPTFF